MQANRVRRALRAAVIAFPSLMPLPSLAQDLTAATPEEFLALLETFEALSEKPRMVVVQGVATAGGTAPGTIFFSVSGTFSRDGGDGVDGSLSVGTAFGDASKFVNTTISANITSADPADFADSGSLSLKFSRNLPAGAGSLGVTIDNLAGWGDAEDNKVKVSVAHGSTHRLRLGNGETMPIAISVGLASYTSYNDGVTPFIGLGIGLSERLSASLSHNGDYVSVGVTTRIPGVENANFSANIVDVLDTRDERRLTLSASFALSDMF